MIRFFTFAQFHNRKGVGSTKIRVENLIKYWDEADLYQYGENPDVLIFQKVYVSQDYKFPKYFSGLKILDICDPDFLDGALIKETLDAMDGVVTSTDALKDFLAQLTDKPVTKIADRFDLEEFPAPKMHTGKLRRAVWFGYEHNASLLKAAMISLAKRNIALTVISDKDPEAHRWANDETYKDKYTYYKYNQSSLYGQLQECDVCILPPGTRPRDPYKSNNRTIISTLCGLPVVTDATQLDELAEAESRNDWVRSKYEPARKSYDVNRSVEEYKKFIQQLLDKKAKK